MNAGLLSGVSIVLTGMIFLAPLSSRGDTLVEYRFDEKSAGQLVYADSSGNGRDLKFAEPVAQSDEFPFSENRPELKTKDRSLFNEVSDLGHMGGMVLHADSIHLSSNDAFTIEGWVRWQSGRGGLCRVHGEKLLLWMGWDNLGKISITYSQGVAIPVEARLPVDEWTHLAYVYSKGHFIIYVNGEVVLSGDIPQESVDLLSEPVTKIILMEADGPLLGYCDDFRLSDTALPPEQLGFHKPFTEK